jgi:hypothetical protein
MYTPEKSVTSDATDAIDANTAGEFDFSALYLVNSRSNSAQNGELSGIQQQGLLQVMQLMHL